MAHNELLADVDFFSRVREQVNQSASFRKLGSADFSLVFAIGDTRCRVDFEAFEVASVRGATTDDERDVDLVLRLGAREWQDYLSARRDGSGLSLLSLDLDLPDGLVKARNPLSRLTFERYNLTLQAFVDAGAGLAA